MVESGKVADVVPEYPSSTSRIRSVGALNRLPNVGTWAGEEQLVQPTIPMGRSRFLCSGQKRAPSDGQRIRQGLVAPALPTLEDGDMREFTTRLIAVLSALGTLITLAIAGGASFRGW